MELTVGNSRIKKENITFVALAIIFVCSLLTGLLPQKLLSTVILLMCVVLFSQDALFLAFPFTIFYNDMYGIVLGMSVDRLISLLLLLKFVLTIARKKELHIKYFIPLFVYLFYSLLVIANYDIRRSAVSFLDVICCVLIVSRYLRDDSNNLRNFFKVYFFVAVSAFITGMLSANVYMHGEMSRFLATFEDPNYMGYFYTTGIFAIISLKLFKPWFRYVAVVFMYVAILASLSLSAIVTNVFLWLIYLVVTKSINVKTFVICVLAIIFVFSVYNYGLLNPETEYIGNFSSRVENAINKFTSGDLSGATTGRFGLTIDHIEYFNELPLLKKLFGGVPVNAHHIESVFSGSAHNEYVDMLLNIGIVGTIIMLSYTFSNLIKSLKQYYNTENRDYLGICMIKFTWCVYCLSLTVFMDNRFMISFLL